MTGKLTGYPVYPKRIGQTVGTPGSTTRDRQTPQTGGFQSILNERLQGQPVKLSAHAQKRLETRGIVLDKQQMDKLTAAVDKAASKGARESLILMGDIALVTSIANRTVITAVDGDHMKENVFTNIDSAVIT